VEPAEWGHGLRFVADGVEIPVDLDFAEPEPGATILVRGSARVSTPEHLLAALVGAGVTDARVVLDGPEVPILDGSALPWWDAIRATGLESGPDAPILVVETELSLTLDGGEVRFAPGDGCRVEVEVDFPGGPRGSFAVDEGGFAEVAAARTFIRERDVTAALAMGRGHGANADNTVVWGASGALGSLRFPDEPVRHKALDAMGDLALLGAVFRGCMRVIRGSHRLHVAALRALRQEMR
jgi:UDP-3-O-[3-hydroxymyristoyl] N-acetylglucosamine deacetylase